MTGERDTDAEAQAPLRLKPTLVLWAAMLVVFLVAVLIYGSFSMPFLYRVFEIQQIERAGGDSTQGAILDYEDYLRIEPTSLRIRGLLVDALIERRRYDRAVKQAIEAEDVAEDAQQRHFSRLLLGRSYLAIGGVNSAADAIEQTIDVIPESGEARYQLAQLHLARGEFDQMYPAYAAAKDLGPANSTAEYAEKWVARSDRVDEMQQELAHEGESAQLLYRFGLTLERLGRVDEAVDVFVRACAFEDVPAAAHFWRGVALERQEELDEAKSAYAMGAKGPKAHSLARYALARLNAS